MTYVNEELKEMYGSTDQVIERLKNMSPTVAEYIIEKSKGEAVISLSISSIEKIYLMGKFKLLVDFSNNIFVEDSVEIVDLTINEEVCYAS